jgi:hypothetical protein
MILVKQKGLIRSASDRNKNLRKTNLILLLALSMMIFVVPVIQIKDHHLTRVLLAIVVVSGLFAADFSRAAFRILFSIGTLVVLVTLLNLVLPDSRELSAITFTLNTLYFIVITIALVAHVASAKEVFGSTLLCAINSYLLIGLTLSILFLIMDLMLPGSFIQVEAGQQSYSTFVYYGFVTLTTLGYGDITPDSLLAKSLSTFTALFGQLYLVIIMAILIGKYLIEKKPAE